MESRNGCLLRGSQVNKDFVVDSRCGQINVQATARFFYNDDAGEVSLLAFSRLIFSSHPITKGIEQVMFPFISSINVKSDSTLRYTSLINSSDKSNTIPAPLMFDINKKWNESDFTKRNISMGGIVEKSGSAGWKIIVYGDGDFAVNTQEGRALAPDNINLLVNSVDWLSDDSGLMELRTKGAVTHPIKEIDESKRSMIKYVNFLLPVLLVILYGFIRSQRSKSIRIQRMQERYN
jgi:hypothetical protein